MIAAYMRLPTLSRYGILAIKDFETSFVGYMEIDKRAFFSDGVPIGFALCHIKFFQYLFDILW